MSSGTRCLARQGEAVLFLFMGRKKNAAQASNRNTNKASLDSFHLEFKHLWRNHAGTTMAWTTSDAAPISDAGLLAAFAEVPGQPCQNLYFTLNIPILLYLLRNCLRMVPMLCSAGSGRGAEVRHDYVPSWRNVEITRKNLRFKTKIVSKASRATYVTRTIPVSAQFFSQCSHTFTWPLITSTT